MKEIFARRSIRRYLDTMPTPAQIHRLLRAGMAAPSAGDSRDWSFLLVSSKEGKEKFMAVHEYSGAVKTAPLLIIVCARTEGDKYPGKDFWLQNACAAIENILIEATHLGLGSLWMAIYPWQPRTQNIADAFRLPPGVLPIGAVAVGTAAAAKPPIDRYMGEYVFAEQYGTPYLPQSESGGLSYGNN